MTTGTDAALVAAQGPALAHLAADCAACGKRGLRIRMTPDGPDGGPVAPLWFCGREGTETFVADVAACTARQSADRAAETAMRAAGPPIAKTLQDAAAQHQAGAVPELTGRTVDVGSEPIDLKQMARDSQAAAGAADSPEAS